MNTLCYTRDPVFDVVRASGRKDRISIAGLTSEFEADPVTKLDMLRPDLQAAALQLLIGLANLSFQPDDVEGWHELWMNPLSPEQLREAINPWDPYFTLDAPSGPRMFQDYDMVTGVLENDPDIVPARELLIDGKHEHFAVDAGTGVLCRRIAGFALQTLQTEASSGGRGHRKSLRGGSALTTLIRPGPRREGGAETLYDLVLANMRQGSRPSSNAAADILAWLKPIIPGKKRVTTPEDGHVLTESFATPRRIKLIIEPNSDNRACDLTGDVDDYVVTGYVRLPDGPIYAGFRHNLSPYYRKKAEHALAAVQGPNRRMSFEDWSASRFRSTDGNQEPATVVTNFLMSRLANIEPPARRGARMQISGYAMDNAKVLRFHEEVMPVHVPSDTADDQALKDLSDRLVQATKAVEAILAVQVRRALYRDKDPAAKTSSSVHRSREKLWIALDEAFHGSMAKAAQDTSEAFIDQIENQWKDDLKEAALNTFDSLVVIDDRLTQHPDRVVRARNTLLQAVSGSGPVGKKIFTILNRPMPAKLAKTKSK
jgi:CRISPR system Cascade subunit CasA